MNRPFVSILLALSLSVFLWPVPLSMAQTSTAVSVLRRPGPLGGINLGGRADTGSIGPDDVRQMHHRELLSRVQLLPEISAPLTSARV